MERIRTFLTQRQALVTALSIVAAFTIRAFVPIHFHLPPAVRNALVALFVLSVSALMGWLPWKVREDW